MEASSFASSQRLPTSSRKSRSACVTQDRSRAKYKQIDYPRCQHRKLCKTFAPGDHEPSLPVSIN